ncbi:MAG: hypothetical protein HN336_08935 [Lentimicrobiaceae bacterium]|jgi:hypothetical protein|nr:hypothetical protein [Lentimicrobiaceae bacterium]MCP4910627.1 hypothetical protein [Bacteroidota bacterium]MDG1902271.1 hypothetical protein [Bacteroidales bacterium]MBT3174963.1 hypothetical protein [Lentimicrobiaceae bacterium]MBT3454860.1 hypothetical protein [Lentimicrobiaceae bacterium]|tara:strand:+ start:375 stop:848 length:474 start_codon:yes stop_codon:yes gene_type:complete
MVIKIIEFIRIAGATFGTFWAYQVGMNTITPYESVLHILTPWLIVSIAGTSAIEGLFFGKQSAAEKGFVNDGNYAYQSRIGLLSYAVISLLVYFENWGPKAELTIILTFLFFMFFSALNHGYQAFVKKNYHWENLNRPFLTILLIVAIWYPVYNLLF